MPRHPTGPPRSRPPATSLGGDSDLAALAQLLPRVVRALEAMLPRLDALLGALTPQGPTAAVSQATTRVSLPPDAAAVPQTTPGTLPVARSGLPVSPLDTLRRAEETPHTLTGPAPATAEARRQHLLEALPIEGPGLTRGELAKLLALRPLDVGNDVRRLVNRGMARRWTRHGRTTYSRA